MVEENTTTCACQGGWMCPNCADQHRAEISRLKAELEELQSAYDELRLLADGRLSIKPEYVRNLERQLAEARHSYDVLKIVYDNLEKTHYETTYDRVQRLESQLAEARAEVAALNDAKVTHYICGAADARQQARQEAAREILEWAAGPESYDEWVVMVRERFGLEG